MNRMVFTLAVCGALGVAHAQNPPAASQETCGEELADSAKLPRQLANVVSSVADSLEAHANWVGTASPEAKAESQKLRQLAKSHRELAARAQKLDSAMTASKELPEARHDLRNVPPALTQSMERAAREMRTFAQLLNDSANEWDNKRSQLQGTGGSGEEGTGGSGPSGLPHELEPSLEGSPDSDPFMPDDDELKPHSPDDSIVNPPMPSERFPNEPRF